MVGCDAICGRGMAQLTIGFPATAGEVLFADVLLLPNGMSKVGANV